MEAGLMKPQKFSGSEIDQTINSLLVELTTNHKHVCTNHKHAYELIIAN